MITTCYIDAGVDTEGGLGYKTDMSGMRKYTQARGWGHTPHENFDIYNL